MIEGVSNTDPYTWNDPGFTVFAPINVLGNNWVFSGGLTFNGTGLINDVSDGYWVRISAGSLLLSRAA